MTAVVDAFRDDPRVVVWDLYNEPGNEGLLDSSLPLLTAAFTWARQAAPEQPLTAGIWNTTAPFERLNRFQLSASDIVTFHSYDPIDVLEDVIHDLRRQDRPLLCTEYLARNLGSGFETHLPVFRDLDIGAISWGLVSGKTQTIYPWWSWFDEEPKPEPEIWFHDVLRGDGTAFDSDEAAFLKKFLGSSGDKGRSRS